MTLKEHNKHTQLIRPVFGTFGRNEWAITGTSCATIKKLSDDLINALGKRWKCAYADASHINENDETTAANITFLSYTEASSMHQLNYSAPFSSFQYHQLFNETDLVLVNGNHFGASKQILVIDERKKDSLFKKRERLNNIELFLYTEGHTEPFDFIREAIPGWRSIPSFHINERAEIIAFLKEKITAAVPPLNGLVLAGGKSIRMGMDKGALQWHQKEQRYYVADMLKTFCTEVYISCRQEQESQIAPEYPTLPDTFMDLGPYGAILSAFRKDPQKAWLVIACDLPLLDHTTIAELMAKREPSALATAYESPEDLLPEPLIAIWEPKAYQALLTFLGQGYSCPRKVLRNNAVKLIKASRPETLWNVNTPEEAEKMKQQFNKTNQ